MFAEKAGGSLRVHMFFPAGQALEVNLNPFAQSGFLQGFIGMMSLHGCCLGSKAWSSR